MPENRNHSTGAEGPTSTLSESAGESAGGKAGGPVKDNDKIEEELTIDELLPELRKVIDGYEEAGKKMAWNAVLTIPFLGELVEAVGDAQETYDTFVENLEPELKASLLLLQLLNSKLEVDKDMGKEGVTIPQGSVEALNDLMKQTLSGATKKHLEQIILFHMKYKFLFLSYPYNHSLNRNIKYIHKIHHYYMNNYKSGFLKMKSPKNQNSINNNLKKVNYYKTL